MPHGPIAELIRTRKVKSDGEIAEMDIVVCPVDHETELLEARPGLRDWKRNATRSLESNVVLFLPPCLACYMLDGSVADSEDRHV